MLKNNVKIILRTLNNQKSFTAIHVVGLTLGLTCCLLIYLFIQHELSFDKFHTKVDRIYRVCGISTNQSGTGYSGGTPYPMAPALRTDMTGLEEVARMHFQRTAYAKVDNNDIFKVDNVIFAEPQLAKIFDFEQVSGDIIKSLEVPNQGVISRKLAKQFFGESDPIGRTINIDDKVAVEITSVMENLPSNSSLQADLLISYESFGEAIIGFDPESWGVSVGGTAYVTIPKNTTIEQFNALTPAFVNKYFGDDSSAESEIYFQPYSEMHFDTKFDNAIGKSPINPSYLWVFGSIGLFILVIAIFNFVNLSTVQALKRAKEVGIRKVLGADKKQLIGQILGEALLITSISGLLAAVASQLTLPFINELLTKNINESLLQTPMVWAFLVATVLIVGLLSGIYPAINFSNFEPIKVLKSRTTAGNRSSLWMRRGLVVAQFTITMTLIIGTIVVSKQLNYLKNKDLGFKKEAIITIGMPNPGTIEVMRSELLAHPNIENVTFSIGAPTSRNNIGTNFYVHGTSENESFDTELKTVDFEYFDVYGLELAAGRWMTKEEERRAVSEEIPDEEKAYKFVVNETLIKKIGYPTAEEAIGQKLILGVNDITAEIIGVTKDFNTSSLHDEIPATLMLNLPDLYYDAGIKIKTDNVDQTIAHIKTAWTTQFPNSFFSHRFLDESIEKLYQSESQMFYLFQIFAGIAILIACLGLWGLINFVTQQRTKEIGVRKIIGASIPNIVMMLSKDFIFLIFIAAIIATPLAWYAMNEWLQNFAYSTNMAWWIFVLATVITVLITFLTVGYQSFRAAVSNPVDSLRAE